MVLLFLFGPQSVPPLPENLADRPVVLVWVPLVHQSSMALAENHEGIHWSPDVVLLFLKAKETQRHVSLCIHGNLMSPCAKATFPGLFLSPSLGSALRD